MMSFTVLFTKFGPRGFSGGSGFGLDKYTYVLKNEISCKVTGLMFS